MLDRPLSMVTPRPSPRSLLGAHLAVIGLAIWAIARIDSVGVAVLGSIVAGTSLFAWTNLVRAASQGQLARHRGGNEALGMLAGWPILAPLAAVRAFETAHLQATNEPSDPNQPLRSRWMLVLGAPVALALIHRHALRTLRGRALGGYLLETVAMLGAVGALLTWLPGLIGARAVVLPLLVAAGWHNLRIVAEHLDLPAGRFHDTWQLALPGPLSRWLLHADHHLEQHLRPGLRWHELPVYRAEIVRSGFVPLAHQVTALGFARVVVGKRGPIEIEPTTPEPAPRWAGRAAIRARPRQPNHPKRETRI